MSTNMALDLLQRVSLNVIIHSVRKEIDEDLISVVISIGDSLGLNVYKEDIHDVYRLPNRDDRSA